MLTTKDLSKKTTSKKHVSQRHLTKKHLGKRNLRMEVIFEDYPEFKPNLTPEDIFRLGSFGGTYWRPIYSSITEKNYKNIHKKYPKSWWKGIPEINLTNKWTNYDKNINKYKVKVGSTLEDWENSNWIRKDHPYGWVHWYCDFYLGHRCDDDERQINRWIRTAGPKSRFRRALINLIQKKGSVYDDFEISPKIRQTLQHWGYQLTKKDFK